MPLYSFQHYDEAGSGNGFDFAVADTDALAMMEAESRMRWQCSHAVEVFEGETLVGSLNRPVRRSSSVAEDLLAQVERICVRTSSAA